MMTTVTKTKALRVATRCSTIDQFVSTFHRFCDETSFFISTLGTRPIGLETPFSIQLDDGKPVLQGLCVVLEAFATPSNRFDRPGVRLGLRRLTNDSVPIYKQLLAAKSPIPRPPPIPVRVVTETHEVVAPSVTPPDKPEARVSNETKPLPAISRSYSELKAPVAPPAARRDDTVPKLGKGAMAALPSWATAPGRVTPAKRMTTEALPAVSKPPAVPAPTRTTTGSLSVIPPDVNGRTPGSELVLPANPLMNLSDESLQGFVDCTLYEEVANFFDEAVDGEPGLTDFASPRTRTASMQAIAAARTRTASMQAIAEPLQLATPEIDGPLAAPTTPIATPVRLDSVAAPASPDSKAWGMPDSMPVATPGPSLSIATPVPGLGPFRTTSSLQPFTAPPPTVPPPAYPRTTGELPALIPRAVATDLPAIPTSVSELPADPSAEPGSFIHAAPLHAMSRAPAYPRVTASELARVSGAHVAIADAPMPAWPVRDPDLAVARLRRRRKVLIAAVASLTVILVVVIAASSGRAGADEARAASLDTTPIDTAASRHADRSPKPIIADDDSPATGLSATASRPPTTLTSTTITAASAPGSTASDDDVPAPTGLPVVGSGPCRMTVTSTPAGSIISVDGNPVGPSPLTIANACQRTRIDVIHPRYQSQVRWVPLAAGTPASLDVTLSRPTHAVTVLTLPPGAEVKIDGRRAGTTPTIVQVMGYTSLDVTIEKAGYATMTKRVYSKAATDRMFVRLTKK